MINREWIKKNVNIRESNEEFTREQILKDCFEITHHHQEVKIFSLFDDVLLNKVPTFYFNAWPFSFSSWSNILTTFLPSFLPFYNFLLSRITEEIIISTYSI